MPISDMPVHDAENASGLAAKVSAYIHTARRRVADGVTVAELAELTLSAMRVGISLFYLDDNYRVQSQVHNLILQHIH